MLAESRGGVNEAPNRRGGEREYGSDGERSDGVMEQWSFGVME